MSDTDDLLRRLDKATVCRRCSCPDCEREGMGELHDHVCTHGPGCVETADKLKARVRWLSLMCADAVRTIREMRKEIKR